MVGLDGTRTRRRLQDDASLLVAAYGLAGHTFAVLRLDLARDELALVSEIGGRPVGYVARG